MDRPLLSAEVVAVALHPQDRLPRAMTQRLVRVTLRAFSAMLPLAAFLPTPACRPAAAIAPKSDGCAMSSTDAAWVDEALATWKRVSTERLKLPPTPLPTMVMFDARCRYSAPPRADGRVEWIATKHDGRVRLPDGKDLPVAVVSFAAQAGGATDAFFVMALPSVWRADPAVRSELGIEGLTTSVLLHELVHAYQFYFVNPTLKDLTARYHLPDDISDDSLQQSFQATPAYVADYTAERDLLFAAALTPDAVEGKRLAAAALAKLRDRRARWFSGGVEKEQWGPLDEIFLTMEGLGQWTAYSWVRDVRGPHLEEAAALHAIRRDGRYWTQDEGLALFLTIDRFVPGWQERAFAVRPDTAEALLALAAK